MIFSHKNLVTSSNSEAAVDSLFGDSGLDWFWKYSGDATDKVAAETENYFGKDLCATK